MEMKTGEVFIFNFDPKKEKYSSEWGMFYRNVEFIDDFNRKRKRVQIFLSKSLIGERFIYLGSCNAYRGAATMLALDINASRYKLIQVIPHDTLERTNKRIIDVREMKEDVRKKALHLLRTNCKRALTYNMFFAEGLDDAAAYSKTYAVFRPEGMAIGNIIKTLIKAYKQDMSLRCERCGRWVSLQDIDNHYYVDGIPHFVCANRKCGKTLQLTLTGRAKVMFSYKTLEVC
jgi:hypothetical protein